MRSGTETEEDRLDVAREKLGRWSREGSEAGDNAKLFSRDEDLHRGKLGKRDPNLALQLEKLASEPCRLFFFCRGLPEKSLSLRKPRS